MKTVAVKLAIVPREVSEESSTVLLSVVFVSVEASAVTVMSADPLKLTVLIVLAVCSVVAVVAFVADTALPLHVVDVAALPVQEPELPVQLPVTFPVTPPFAVISPVTVSGGVTVKVAPPV